MRGNDVPGDAPAAQQIKRAKRRAKLRRIKRRASVAPRPIWLVTRAIIDNTEWIEQSHLPAAAQGGGRTVTGQIVQPQDVGVEQAVEFPALKHARDVFVILRREDAKIGFRVAPAP